MQPGNSQKPKVLIADDEASYRLMLTIILEECGWEVSTANNGRDAIQKVLAEKPDLLILDYHMPVLTGGEVYQNLQSNGIKLPVVLVSSEIALEKLASSLGIPNFLHKPFDVGELITIVQSAYEQSRNQ